MSSEGVPVDLDRELRGHGPVLEGLWTAARSGRLPHGLLFHGPEGSGRFLAMQHLAAGLLCERGPGPPCGACGPCKRVRSGNHADLFHVDSRAAGYDELTIHFVVTRPDKPAGAFPGPAIDEFLSLKAQEGGWRVVLLRETERMNVPAQNAFLKTLEEPGPGVLLVLECSRPTALLDTVRSRVVAVRCGALAEDDVRAVLRTEGVPEEELDGLVRLADGAPGRGLRLRGQGAPAMLEVLGRAVLERANPAALRAELAGLEGDFPGRTAAAKARERGRVFLDLGLEVLRDLARAEGGRPVGGLVHGALVARLRAAGFRGLDLDAHLTTWMGLREALDLNLTVDTPLERALDDARTWTPVGAP